MKLHRIRLCNLNSLYGEQELDLDAGLGNAPLFLVVGPTGAGKSTLLDAICLALFGTTPRLDRAKSVKVGDGDARRVMSHGTGDCWAEVEFSKLENAERRRYRARWRCSRARGRADGRLQDPHRSLERRADDGTWAILVSDHRRKFFDGPFEEVLEGMTPAEFNRAILLAQGDFAAFLKASVADRAALLERLTDTEIYKRLGSRANQRRQEVEAALKTTRAVAEGIEFLTDEERTARAEAKASLGAALAEATRLRDRRRELLTWLRTRESLGARLAEAEAAARAAGQAWAERAADFERLREHQRCEEAARLAESTTVVSADRAGAEVELGVFEGRLTEQIEGLAAGRRAAEEAAARRADAEKRRAALEPTLDAATLARARAADAGRQSDEAAQELATARSTADEARRAAGEARKAAEAAAAPSEAAAAVERATESLAAALDGEPDPAARRRALSAILVAGQERRALLRRALEAQERAAAAERRATRAEGHRARVERAAADADGAAAEAAERLQEATAAAADETALRENLGWTLAVVRGRENLVAGEPCALCGATDHAPDSAPHEPEVAARLAAADERLERSRRRLTERAAEDRAAATAAAEGRAALQAASEAAREAGEARAAALADLADGLAAAELPESAAPGALREVEAAIVAAGRTATAALDTLEIARERLARSRETLAGAEERARSTGEAARAAQARADAAEAAVTEARGRAERREAEHKRRSRAEGDAIEAVRTAMADASEAAGTLDLFSPMARPSDLDLDALEAEADESLQRHRAADEEAKRAVARREAEVAAATSARDAAKRRLEALAERLFEREDLLLKALGAVDLPDVSALRACRLPAAEADLLDTERTRLADAAARAATVFTERSAALGEHDERAPDHTDEEVGPEELAEAIGGLEVRIEQLQQEHADARSVLDLDDEHRRRHRDLLEEERRARGRAEVWQRLHRLIGVGDGQAFKNFAQILNLGELIGKANHHLLRLSDRYRLTPALDEEGRPRLSFAVIDRYQADEQRPLTTLSGGETFLVSLSLALALADFRTVRMPIETLLLDEGFGTLDHATLDVAMNALDRLQAGGTQVGIISHLEALKTRVPAQVLVEPVGDGRSVVRVRPPEPAVQLAPPPG